MFPAALFITAKRWEQTQHPTDRWAGRQLRSGRDGAPTAGQRNEAPRCATPCMSLGDTRPVKGATHNGPHGVDAAYGKRPGQANPKRQEADEWGRGGAGAGVLPWTELFQG